jgi:hypothetical protein
MSDSDVYDHSNLEPSSGGSSPTNAELEAPGIAGRNAFAGFKTLPKEEAEEKTYRGDESGLREAAKDHAEGRSSSEGERDFLHVPNDGAQYALTASQAGKLLSQEKQLQQTVNDVLEVDGISKNRRRGPCPHGQGKQW